MPELGIIVSVSGGTRRRVSVAGAHKGIFRKLLTPGTSLEELK